MEYEQKVLWSEGMFLTPQHFQQWDRHHDYLQQQRFHGLQPLGYGVSEFRIDRDAVGRGEFVVSAIRAVLPDGTCIDVPNLDPLPESRAIQQWFKPELKTLDAYIAVPRHRTGGRVYELSERIGSSARYTASTVSLRDETTGEDERPVQTARKNVRIVFDGEPMQDLEKIRIARLVRTEVGGYAIAPECVPPLLDLSASPYVTGILRTVLEQLVEKSRLLFEQRGQSVTGTATITAGDAGSFWLLHTVNGYIPPLQHFHARATAAMENPSLGSVHPELVYLEIARLVGELCTFGLQGASPIDTPPYRHEDPGATFRDLADAMQGLLVTSISTNCRKIPIERVGETPYFFNGRVGEEGLLDSAHFYLSIGASVPHGRLIEEIPTRVKITSVDRLDRVVRLYLDGLELSYLHAPPEDLPRTAGRSIFEIDRSGEHWEAISRSKDIGIYVPPEFESLQIELLAVIRN